MKTKLKKELKSCIQDFSENTSLIYAGIVGSFNSKKLPRDIDLLLLFDKLDASQYKVIISKFCDLSRDLTDKNYKFIVEERNGPFKPSNNLEKKTIQFHLIVQDRNFFNYTLKVAPLSYIEWTFNNQRLFGKNIFRLFPKKRIISKNMLLDAEFGGINSSIKLLKDKKIYYSIYEIKSGKLKLVVKTKEANRKDQKNLLIGVVKANVRNFVKYKTKNLSPDNNLIENTIKKQLREVYPLTMNFFNEKKVNLEDALTILESIKDKVIK